MSLMSLPVDRGAGRRRRHRRLRKKIVGMPDRPRLSVFRSHQQLYAQLVDDVAGRTLRGWSTKDERLTATARGGNIGAATELGKLLAADLVQSGTTRIVFDRGGYPDHGRVKALAEAVRS